MYQLMIFFACAALICLLLALWKPRLYPFAAPTRAKAAAFYGLCAGALLVLAAAAGPGPGPAPQRLADSGQPRQTGREEQEAAKTMAWTLVDEETVCLPDSLRHRLIVAIVPAEEQEDTGPERFLATAREVAMQKQKECEIPVVVVNMVAQKAGTPLGRGLLAQVVYIPDGMGLDGLSENNPLWESQMAAQRGFSGSELAYMKLWTAMFRNYLGPSGIDEEALDAAISDALGVQRDSLDPFANRAVPQ